MFTKRIIQIAISIAVVAFILSTSRIFLSTAERTGESDFYAYNLAQSGPMTAFISIIILSVLAVILGAWLIKKYDIIGHPLLYSGIITLTIITIINYAYLSFSENSDNVTANVILLTIFSFELVALIMFAELKMPNIEKQKTSPPSAIASENVTTSTPAGIKETPPTPPPRKII